MEEDEPDQEDYNYEDDYGENINMEDDKIIGGNYELLTKDEMDKERNKKIDEFIQISDLSKSQAE